MEMTYQIHQINDAAAWLWEQGKSRSVWAFDAPMGSGKTTLIHALCTFLDVHDAVASPTFAIVNQYESPVAGTIWHMDWYRLKGEEEAMAAGIEELLYAGGYCWIEWPEKAREILPEDCWWIKIEWVNDETRKIIIQGNR
jgi:tRNA threonylcarbamoyladenosine biosynthesis protein TsaE